MKTKQRNRLKVKNLEAILRIRLFLHNRGGCCKNLIVTKDMLDKFNVSMYATGDSGVNVEDDENVEEVVNLLPPELCD